MLGVFPNYPLASIPFFLHESLFNLFACLEAEKPPRRDGMPCTAVLLGCCSAIPVLPEQGKVAITILWNMALGYSCFPKQFELLHRCFCKLPFPLSLLDPGPSGPCCWPCVSLLALQASGTSSSSAATTPSVSTPVTGHKRMIIPNQPPLTATKKSTAKGPGQPAPIPVTPVGTLKPQPVPASYATASTPSRPAFNVQVRTAQPSPHYQPPSPQPGHYGSLGPGQPYGTAPSRQPAAPQYGAPQAHGPSYGYGPPAGRPAEPAYGYAPLQGRYQEPYYGGYGGRNGSEAPYVPQSSWKAEPAYPASNAMGQAPPGLYQPPGTKKTYITDPVLAPQPPTLQQKVRDAGGHWHFGWENVTWDTPWKVVGVKAVLSEMWGRSP